MQRALWLALILLGLPLAAVAAPGPGETVRWSGEVVLEEDFVVPSGVTLLIEAGTVVRARSYEVDPPRGPAATVIAEGTVLIEGTRDSPVRFFTILTLVGPGADGSRITNAHFDAASTHDCVLRSVDATYVMESSRFTNNTWTVCIEGGAPVIRDSVFLYNGFMERSDPYGGRPCVESRAEPDAHVQSVECPPASYMSRDSPGEHDRCWVVWSGRELCRGTGGVDQAVSVSAGAPRIEGNHFESNEGGIYIHRTASATVRQNVFIDQRHGARIDASIDMHDPDSAAGRRVLVEENRFERNGDAQDFPMAHGPTGLSIVGRVGDWSAGRPIGGVVIRSNVFVENGAGAVISGDAYDVRFEDNDFVGNSVGLASEYGRALVQDCRFDNRELDILLVGNPAYVRLLNTTFDPAKVHIEGAGVVEHEGGIIRNLTLAALLGTLLLAAAGLFTEAGRWLLGKGAISVLYARISRSESLAHPARELLMARIRGEPGIHLRELAREAGSYGGAVYHLTRLERDGHVRSARSGVLRRFYPAGQAPADSELAPVAQRVLFLAREQPGVTLAEAARLSGCSRQLALHHARALQSRGMVRLEKDDRGRQAIHPVALEASRS